MLSTALEYLARFVFLLDVVFACIIVFFERKNPGVTWAWLMVVLLIPYGGFIIYLILGQDSRKYRVFAQKGREDAALIDQYLKNNAANIKNWAISLIDQSNMRWFKKPGYGHLNDLVYLNNVAGLGAFTENNQLTLFHEGNSKFERMLRDIQNAQTYIHMQYYIVRKGKLADKLLAALTEKARQGVEVKFLFDGMGCATTPQGLYKPLKKAGGEIGEFLPPYFVRLNFRNHRKICVIDGHIGYLGGLNIGDEYLGLDKRFGYWRDSHIRIVGDAVKQLELRFIMDWSFSTKTRLPFLPKYFPELSPAGRGKVPMQIVSSGPDTQWPSIYDGYNKMIGEAETSIYIQTPYFVPDDSIYEALRVAALAGLDVRIMIPAHPDHPFVYWAALSYLSQLMPAGVRCYQYETGFVHSKLLMIDGKVTSVGTANMDVRSFRLNFECNAFIYDEDTTLAFQKEFLSTLDKDCTEMDQNWFANRSAWKKIKESISRLLSPLL